MLYGMKIFSGNPTDHISVALISFVSIQGLSALLTFVYYLSMEFHRVHLKNKIPNSVTLLLAPFASKFQINQQLDLYCGFEDYQKIDILTLSKQYPSYPRIFSDLQKLSVSRIFNLFGFKGTFKKSH